MTVLRLEGCRSEPLGSYLKALAVLRLVAEQKDPEATGRWEHDAFVLDCALDADGLATFLVERYRPTPLVAPWNGGSGFGPKDQQAGIAAIEGSSDARLDSYRRAIEVGRRLRGDPRWDLWTKEQQVQACRALLPDGAVTWLDAAVVLTNDDRVLPPLLGTGGNDGRLEFSNNFMQRLVDVLPLLDGEPEARRGRTLSNSLAWARAAVFGGAGAALLADKPIGQFDPGSAGGVNSSPTGAAKSLVNPWDYVLLLEGALLFASGAGRRLGTEGQTKAAMPFMVGAAAVGYATGADAEISRGELWAPLWSRSAGAAEVARLIGEGRASWRRGQARTGLDFARATADLGVDRGVDRFVRHAFVRRFGLAFLAVPVGTVTVQAKPQVPVLAQLDPWVGRIRWAKNLPASVATALRTLDEAQFAVSVNTRRSPELLQDVLVAAAELEATVANSPELRDDRTRSPLQGLAATAWLPLLDDSSVEFRLAASIASQRDPVAVSGSNMAFSDRAASSPTVLLRAVRMASPRRLEWSGQPPRVAGLGFRPLPDVLSEVLARRSIDVTGREEADSPEERDSGQVGVQPSFRYGIRAPLADVSAFVDGAVDEARLDRLLRAFLLLDWRQRRSELNTANWWVAAGPMARPAQPAWALLAPFFHGDPLTVGRDALPREVRLRPDARWPRLLIAGRVAAVVEQALRRLRVARLDPAITNVAAVSRQPHPTLNGTRLAAALLCRLSTRDASRLLSQVAPTPVEVRSTSDPQADRQAHKEPADA